MSGFDKKIDAIEVPSDIFVSIFSAAEEQIEKAVSVLSTNLSQTDVDLSPLENELKSATALVSTELESFASRLTNLQIDESSIFKNVNAEMDGVSQRFSQLSRDLEPLSQSISATTQKQHESTLGLDEVISRLRNILNEDSPIFSALANLSANVERYNTVAEKIERLPTQLEATLEKAGATRDVSGELSSTMYTVTQEFHRVAVSAEDLRGKLEDITAQFERTVSSLVAAAEVETQ